MMGTGRENGSDKTKLKKSRHQRDDSALAVRHGFFSLVRDEGDECEVVRSRGVLRLKPDKGTRMFGRLRAMPSTRNRIAAMSHRYRASVMLTCRRTLHRRVE